jgi:bis(5'-nucleosyl)-tetraphosphatase (symmetrical)
VSAPLTWVVGDVQGCDEPLRRLVAAMAFRPGVDRMVLLGDLVNRGPGSLEVLRWCVRTPGVDAILGNHDLHALGRWLGVEAEKKRDTLDALLAATDAAELLTWLRARPFVMRLDAGPASCVAVHAGLPPGMSVDTALECSASLETMLAGPEAAALLTGLRARRPHAWAKASGLEPQARLVVAAQAFTLMRTCDAEGTPDLGFDASPETAPTPLRPWWDLPSTGRESHTILFGHWAAAGVRRVPGGLALDAGCVWGRALAAYCVDHDRVVTVPAAP